MYSSHLPEEVLSASPVGLVRLLFRELRSSVRKAREKLRAGEILARGTAISKAQLILVELTNSLDLEAGGQIGAELEGLYDFMLNRLREAHATQSDEPLAEVLSVAGALEDAWAQLDELGPSPCVPIGLSACGGIATGETIRLCG